MSGRDPDFNGDGYSDLAIAGGIHREDRRVSWAWQRDFTGPVWYRSGGSALFFAIGDFDGDKKDDLAAYTWSWTNQSLVGVLLGRGDGTFADPLTFVSEAPSVYSGLAAEEPRRKRPKRPSHRQQSSDTVRVYLSQGDGTFTFSSAYLTGGHHPDSIAIADFNGDAWNDVV